MALVNIEIIMDGIENYDIGVTISRGPNVKISIATCRRGRLKGRKVALKMISKGWSIPTLDENSYRAALQLHRHLHHPDILSLLSTFESPSAFYEILEYCPHGSLSEWMTLSKRTEPQTLSDAQLRGILQPLVKALLHMHHEKVLHLNTNPNNIFITSDYRVKLGGLHYCRTFGSKASNFHHESYEHALVSGDEAPIPHQKSLFSAPEILMQENVGPAADVWSLGQLCVFLSSGSLQDDGLWNQSISQSASYELRDLIDGLTQADAADRTPLHRILSHPFFNPALPTANLSTFLDARLRGRPKSTDYDVHHGRIILGALNVPWKPPNMQTPSSMAPVRRLSAVQKEGHVSTAKTSAFSPEHEVFPAKSQPKAQNPSTRHLNGIWGPSQARELVEEKSLPIPIAEVESKRPRLPLETRRTALTRELVTAGALPPQTFRTPHGMILIQPSGSVVVDLREGERTKGRRGAAVLVVHSGGTKVDVYSAPHLSLPCVLQEPISTWDLCKLPSEFGKPYEFAAKYLQVVKRRTPMVTLDLSTSKFTIMSNLPLADVEMTVARSHSTQPTEPMIRLRLSRQEDTLEISQYSTTSRNRIVSRMATQFYATAPRSRVTEWSKRTISLVGGRIDMSEIREEERKAVNCLQGCRALWEQFEKTALDMDRRITTTLSDQFLTIKTPLDMRHNPIEGITPVPSGAMYKDGISIYRSPDSVKDLVSREDMEVQVDPKKRLHSTLVATSRCTKPRLGGLGLPPRPRRLSVSKFEPQGQSLVELSLVKLGRKRSAVHWSASVDHNHMAVLRG